MSNVSSAGLFGGRVGTSMDYSQMLEIRRKYIISRQMKNNNPTNSPEIKPHFNQDKFNREPQTNGVVDYYFTRGLTPLYASIGASK
jgi:hypothetical protein